MQRTFISSLVFLVFLNLLVKPAWILGIDLSVQNRVGFETYGLYFALFNFSYLFHIVLDAGITNFNNKTIAAHPERLGKYLSNILLIKAGLAIVYVLITFAAAYLLNYSGLQVKLLAFLAFNQIMASALLYLRSNVSGLHLFRTDAFLSVADKLLMIGLCAYLLWGVESAFQIEWFVYAQTIALTMTTILALGIVLVKANGMTMDLDMSLAREILKKSYPFAFLVLMMAIYYRVDGVMIERMLPEGGTEQAGIYASAYRLLDIFNMAGILFAGLLLPIFSRMFKKSEPVGDLVRLSYRTLMTIAIAVTIAAWFFANDIMSALYTEATPYSGKIFGWLTISFIPISTVYIYGTLMTAHGNLKHLNVIAATGLLLNIVLNLYLIPESQAYGATLATVNTQLLVAGAHLVAANRIFGLKPNAMLIGKLVGYTLITGVGGYFLAAQPGNWIAHLGLFILLAVVVAFVLKLVDLRHTLSLFRAAE